MHVDIHNNIPMVIKRSTRVFGLPLAWEIVEYFTTHEKATYSELVQEFKNYGDRKHLHTAINQMSTVGLLDRFETMYVDGKGNAKFEGAYYTISPWGKAIVNGLMSALKPSPA